MASRSSRASLGQMVDADQGVVGQVVEQGLEPLVEQRQPVLHARRAAPPSLTAA